MERPQIRPSLSDSAPCTIAQGLNAPGTNRHQFDEPHHKPTSFRLFKSQHWPRTPLGESAMRGAGWLVKSALRGIEYIQGIGLELGLAPRAHTDEQSVQHWLDAHGWPSRRLQIGLIEPAGWGRDLLETQGVVRPDWIAINQADIDSREVPDALDGVLTCFPDGQVVFTTCEHDGREAAWFDWNNERPLSYPSVFPVRIDCSQMSIPPHKPGIMPDCRLTRLLIEAAALLSRHPSRIDLDDSLSGRIQSGAGAGSLAESNSSDALVPVMRRMVELLGLWEADELKTPIARMAGRVMGAWASAAASDRVHESLRRVVSDVSSSIVQDEAETFLRAGAVRLADGDDVMGLDALEHATKLLKGKHLQSPPDQVVYILSELQTSGSNPYSIGRVAAGLVLIGATTTPEKFVFFRDDILDEVRLSGVLVDLEQHQLVLLKTLAMLERVLGVKAKAQAMVDAHEEEEARRNAAPEPLSFVERALAMGARLELESEHATSHDPIVAKQAKPAKSRTSSRTKAKKQATNPARASKPSVKKTSRKKSATARKASTKAKTTPPIVNTSSTTPVPPVLSNITQVRAQQKASSKPTQRTSRKAA